MCAKLEGKYGVHPRSLARNHDAAPTPVATLPPVAAPPPAAATPPAAAAPAATPAGRTERRKEKTPRQSKPVKVKCPTCQVRGVRKNASVAYSDYPFKMGA